MGLFEVAATLVFLLGVVFAAFKIVFPPKPQSSRYAEADSLLRELHVIDGLLNVLPSEFRDKLNNYLGGK
jgi:hypothetical protein